MKKLLLLPYIFFTLTLTVYAQGGVSGVDGLEIKTTTNTVRARLVKPIRINNEGAELNFGGIVMRTNIGGTVQIEATPDGNRIFTDNANLSEISNSAEQGSSAFFTFTGEEGLGYIITLPNNTDVNVERRDAAGSPIAGEANEMKVTNFQYLTPESYSGSNLTSQVISGTASNNAFSVGATLTIKTAQNKGTYVGNYVVTMEYQ